MRGVLGRHGPGAGTLLEADAGDSHRWTLVGRRGRGSQGVITRLPGEEVAWNLDPIFPASATDQQMQAIFALFDKLQFFQVVESDVSV